MNGDHNMGKKKKNKPKPKPSSGGSPYEVYVPRPWETQTKGGQQARLREQNKVNET